MKRGTIRYILERVSSNLDDIAPLVATLPKEDWQKCLQITSLIAILRKEI